MAETAIRESRVYQWLAYAGTLPFIASAVMAMLEINFGPIRAPAVIASSYGLAILSFLCGAHWATYLYRRDDSPFNLFVISNVIVVVVWLVYVLTGSSSYTLLTQITAFLYLLFLDQQLKGAGLISAHYFSIRLHATVVAVVSLAVVTYIAYA